MTNSERSVQFWSVLVVAAKAQQVLSYDTLEKITGIPRFGQSKPLGNIYSYCEQNGLPPLTSIVLEQRTGKPADPAFAPPFELAAEHRRVFIFDWVKHGCPKAEQFDQSREKEEASVTA